MFPLTPGGGRAAGRVLAEALRALRRHRGLRPPQIAEAMGMPLRSYEHFESGRGRLNLGRVRDFAEATDTDPFAILASLALDSPDFAVRCADNKLMLILMMSLLDFDRDAARDIQRLEPRTLIAAFTRTFEELRESARGQDPLVEDWFARRRTGAAREPSPSDEG
jgi:transcriptional regulator with XRE-family HTH domain